MVNYQYNPVVLVIRNDKARNKCMGIGMGGSCYYKLVRLQILSFFYQEFLLKINPSIRENKNNKDAH